MNRYEIINHEIVSFSMFFDNKKDAEYAIEKRVKFEIYQNRKWEVIE